MQLVYYKHQKLPDWFWFWKKRRLKQRIKNKIENRSNVREGKGINEKVDSNNSNYNNKKNDNNNQIRQVWAVVNSA